MQMSLRGGGIAVTHLQPAQVIHFQEKIVLFVRHMHVLFSCQLLSFVKDRLPICHRGSTLVLPILIEIEGSLWGFLLVGLFLYGNTAA